MLFYIMAMQSPHRSSCHTLHLHPHSSPPPCKVDLSIINGAVVVEGGRLLTLDVEALRLEAAQRAKRVVAHATHPATN